MIFKEGDIVQVKSYEDLKEEYGLERTEEGIEYIPCDGRFIDEMTKYCNKRMIIKQINIKNEDKTKVRILKGNYAFTQDMFTKEGNIEEIKKSKSGTFYTKKYTEKEIIQAKIDMLNMVDKEKFDKIIAGANYREVKTIKGTTTMLRTWADNKVNYFLMFGRKLKISKDIEIDMTEQDITEDVENLRKSFPLQGYILDRFQKTDIIKNTITVVPDYFKEYFDIQPGMKLTKAMHKIFSDDKYDIELSKLVQKTKKAGKLIVSIDPVDFLFMSKNNSGWHSCHNIFDSNGNHGCYSGGIYSYLEDRATLISYRCSDNKTTYKINKYQIEDVSKSWRELLYCNPDNFYFVSSRQYPYDDDSLTKQVREIYEEQVSNYMNVPNKWARINDDSLARKIVRNNPEGAMLHYNDVLLYTSKHYPILYNKSLTGGMSPKEVPELFDIMVGQKVICPVCGANYISDSGSIQCRYC